ncbi:hypothetical protein HW41_04500 [Apilactobacillus kunkeei]|uniref:hypothetical protein n=1 Tax=Apilactobacillus kunkeei TaxID=148814 RepID=UPI00059AD4B2|nr:hypothetical protein [Apilactobacillus kunkeei]KIM18529.1 hypothetical protein HW41_04500 [Apilactobacillus kunkeei]
MEKSTNKNIVNKLEKVLSRFIHEYIFKNISVVLVTSMLIGILFIFLFRKSSITITIIIFVMTQIIGGYAVFFQLGLESKSKFKTSLIWNTYEMLNESYEKIGELDTYTFYYLSNTASRIRKNRGVNFENFLVNKDENSYMVEYRERLGKYISDVYSISMPVILRLPVYMQDNDFEIIKKQLCNLEVKVKSMKKDYMEAEVLWNEILKDQKDLKEMNKEDDTDKYEEIKGNISKSFKILKLRYKRIGKYSYKLSKENGIIDKFEEQLDTCIRNIRMENKLFRE